MKFVDITVAAGEANSADPRAAPQSVADKLLIDVPDTLTGTDLPPTRLIVALEGTATQTISVTPWVMAEQEATAFEQPAAADRRFYALGAAETVTVGGVQELPAVPGKMYIQIASTPAAASTLRIGFAA